MVHRSAALLLPMVLAFLASAPVALGQQSPPPGALRLPPSQQERPGGSSLGGAGNNASRQPSPPQAAPRTPVQRSGSATAPASPPTVQPRSSATGHKPPPHGAGRPAATPAANRPSSGAARPQHRPAPPTAAAPATPVPATLAPVPEPAAPAEPAKGTNTGLVLPRFAALRSDEVNLRTGPGTRYPIDWVYKRRDLPVEIEREFDQWRLVRDQEGVKGWVHQATLTGRRTAVVTGGERTLRAGAQGDASPVARLKPGVIVRLRSCETGSEWCQVLVGDYRGWLRRDEVWGMLPGEAVQ